MHLVINWTWVDHAVALLLFVVLVVWLVTFILKALK